VQFDDVQRTSTQPDAGRCSRSAPEVQVNESRRAPGSSEVSQQPRQDRRLRSSHDARPGEGNKLTVSQLQPRAVVDQPATRRVEACSRQIPSVVAAGPRMDRAARVVFAAWVWHPQAASRAAASGRACAEQVYGMIRPRPILSGPINEYEPTA
jgi:hypothetical protein